MPVISSLVNVSGTFMTGTTISHIGIGAIGYTGDTDAFSSGTIVFSGDNITVSTSTAVGTQYVLLSGHASSTGMALQGSGTYSQNTGTIQFSNSNGLTFGLHTDGYMTGSHNAFYNSSQLTNTFLTTAMQSVCTSVFVETSNSSLFQHTSATSDITSNAVNTSVSSGFAGIGTTGTNVTMTLNSDGLVLSIDPPDAGIAIQGSGTLVQSIGTVQFANSNSITFGLTNNQMTGSFDYTQSTHEHPYIASESTSVFQFTSATSDITANALNTSQSSLFQHTSATSDITSNAVNTSISSQWLTTAALSNHSHGDISTVSTDGSDMIYTSASNGLTLGVPAWLTTANAYTGISGIGVLVNISLTSLNTTYTSGTVIFMGNQNITVSKSINGASQYVSFSVGNYITTAMESDAGSNFVGLGSTLATTAGTDVAMTFNSAGINLAIPPFITTAAESDHTHSDLYIALANSTDYATSVLSGTFQTTGAYLTTAMASDQGSNYVGLATTGITNASATINSSQLLIDLPAYLTTAAASDHSHGNPTLNLTNLTGTTASASNGMTLSLSGPAHGNVYYVDSNGFSFSSSVDGVSTSIWIVT